MDYNRVNATCNAFLEYCRSVDPDTTYITLINPAEDIITLYAQISKPVLKRRESRYTVKEFCKNNFEDMRRSVNLKF